MGQQGQLMPTPYAHRAPTTPTPAGGGDTAGLTSQPPGTARSAMRFRSASIPIVTSIVLGNPTPTKPTALVSRPTGTATNCCAVTAGAVVTAPPYLGLSCLSQGASAQSDGARLQERDHQRSRQHYLQIGHLQYSAQNPCRC